MSDWDDSSDDATKAQSAPAARKPAPPVKSSKFAGEDEDEAGPASDWEESSEEEAPKKAAPTSAAAPPKKKGTLKAKLAEKEAARARAEAERGSDDDDYDEDAVLNPRDKAKRDRERELKSDLDNAAALFGQSGGASASKEGLEPLLAMNPKTKEDFEKYSQAIIELVIKRHQDKPLYAAFVELHARALAEPLRDVDVRKAASGLTTLANEKQKEQRDSKAGGKKKTKAAARPALGGAKTAARPDTAAYEEALDDFGDDDFM